MLDRDRGESDGERRRFDYKRYLPSALRTPDKTVIDQKFFFSRILKKISRFLATAYRSLRNSILYIEKNSNDNPVSTSTCTFLSLSITNRLLIIADVVFLIARQ